jgi:hypothetical protein
MIQIIEEAWNEDQIGFNSVLHGNSWSKGGPLTFMSPWWIRAHWGRAFEIVELRPHSNAAAGNPQGHGLVLLKKRAVELSPADVDQFEPNEPRELSALRHNTSQLKREIIKLRNYITALEEQAADLRRARS